MATDAFCGIALVWFGVVRATLFPNNLALYLKYLKEPVLSISKLKIVASSLKQNC